MTQIPILQGIYSDKVAAFRTAMPINREPVFIDSGISKGYLGPVAGLRKLGDGPGSGRGGIDWNGTCYRAMGSKLASVTETGTVTTLGDVGNDLLPVSLDYSFDRLAIASNDGLFYYSPSQGVTQVTDPDLGPVKDVIFIDGRFMTTDGISLVITELNDPYSVDPLKYGSAENDPDQVVALAKLSGEVYALGRYTIQNFRNVGGTGFPYQNNPGALISRGIVGRKAWCYFIETFAFIGGGRNEEPSVYLAGGGQSKGISTAEIDTILNSYTPAQLAAVEMETRNEANEKKLFIHLPDKTLCFLFEASQKAQEPIWITLASGLDLDEPYPARHFVNCYGKWLVDTPEGWVGIIDDSISTFFDRKEGWAFQTNFLYNESLGAIVYDLELAGLPGRTPLGEDPSIFFSYTKDGETWSNERRISGGKIGDRQKRLVFRPNVRMSNYMGMKFRGVGTSLASFARLEARLEPLAA